MSGIAKIGKRHIETMEDRAAEYVLNYMEIPYSIETINISDIDWKESAHNCARLRDPLNPEKIEDYRQAMEADDVFPMVVLERQNKGGWLILGGNQRCNAAKEISQDISMRAYVIQPISEMDRDTVVRSLNSRHGWGSDKSERITHAVHMVMKSGRTVKDAAKLMNVSTSTINANIRCLKTKELLSKKGINPEPLSKGALDAIAAIPDDRVAVAVGKAAVEFAPTIDQVASVAAKIAETKSEGERMKLAKAFAKEASQSIRAESVNPRRTISRRRRDQLFRLLEGLSAFLETGNAGEAFTSLEQMQCVPDRDGDKFRMLAERIRFRLNVIEGK